MMKPTTTDKSKSDDKYRSIPKLQPHVLQHFRELFVKSLEDVKPSIERISRMLKSKDHIDDEVRFSFILFNMCEYVDLNIQRIDDCVTGKIHGPTIEELTKVLDVISLHENFILFMRGIKVHFSQYYPDIMGVLYKSLKDIEYSYKMYDGPKYKKQDDLSLALERTVLKLHAKKGNLPTWRQVVESLEFDDTIQEVDMEDKCILWRRSNGIEEKTRFKAVRDRLTTIRKKINK